MARNSAAAAAIVAVLLLQMTVQAVRVEDFQGGGKDASAILKAPGFADTVNISLPAGCHVLGATVNVSGTAAENDPSAFPRDVSVSLDGNILWAFNATGNGALGRQDVFSDGTAENGAKFGTGGGTSKISFKLPKGAAVTCASLEMDLQGPLKILELQNISGNVTYGQLGQSISCAGDLNGDGYDDIIVGAPGDRTGGDGAGRAKIYLGGPSMDDAPLLTFTGNAGDYFGCSVSGAGDVNGDGYGDIIVGASHNSFAAKEAGRAFVFLGGPGMDYSPKITLNGTGESEHFGASVFGAGDFNGDGFDDIVVGAPRDEVTGAYPGSAYIYLGGPGMDGVPDITMRGEAPGDAFGWPVSGAGDLNGDGYDDIIVGAILNDAKASSAGRAYIFFGGPGPDNVLDIVLTGTYAGGWLGYCVAGAGDVNGDGYDDALVGAPWDQPAGYASGAVHVLFGGKTMDKTPDVTINGAQNDHLGFHLSGAGDLNADGYDDFIAGAPWNSSAGASAGAAFVYFGGAAVDTVADMVLRGAGPGDSLGAPVAAAGNVNGDGHADVMVAAPYSGAGGKNTGHVLIYSRAPFVQGPTASIGDTVVWSSPGPFGGKKRLDDLSDALNGYLGSHAAGAPDAYGNALVEIPFRFGAAGEVNITIRNLNITYGWNATIPDFSVKLNGYMAAHRTEKGPDGNLTVPLLVGSRTAGRVRLSGLEISVDDPPRLIGPIPDQTVEEDTADPELVDLWSFFEDDVDPDAAVNFSIASATYRDIATTSVVSGRYLCVDTLTGDANDNWTGSLWVTVRATDSRGNICLSNEFEVAVQNINDAPAITSIPSASALAGMPYEYALTARDGDGDAIFFGLREGPENMTMDPRSGKILWTPPVPGVFRVSASASDGLVTTFHNFTIVVGVRNHPPRFVSTPVTGAVAGISYGYGARAIDTDGDRLEYSLLVWPGGMTVDRSSGNISWSPSRSDEGNFSVAVKVSDGNGGEASQQFTVQVLPFVKARVTVERPLAQRSVSGKYIFSGRAERGTLEVLGVQLRIDSGDWMNATGNESWGMALDTGRLGAGDHTLGARAWDAAGFSDTVSVRFLVDNPSTGLGDTLPIAIMIVAAAGATIAAMALLRHRRKPRIYDWG